MVAFPVFLGALVIIPAVLSGESMALQNVLLVNVSITPLDPFISIANRSGEDNWEVTIRDWTTFPGQQKQAIPRVGKGDPVTNFQLTSEMVLGCEFDGNQIWIDGESTDGNEIGDFSFNLNPTWMRKFKPTQTGPLLAQGQYTGNGRYTYVVSGLNGTAGSNINYRGATILSQMTTDATSLSQVPKETWYFAGNNSVVNTTMVCAPDQDAPSCTYDARTTIMDGETSVATKDPYALMSGKWSGQVPPGTAFFQAHGVVGYQGNWINFLFQPFPPGGVDRYSFTTKAYWEQEGALIFMTPLDPTISYNLTIWGASDPQPQGFLAKPGLTSVTFLKTTTGSASKTSFPIGAIAGIAAGAVVLVALLGFFIWRKCIRERLPEPMPLEPSANMTICNDDSMTSRNHLNPTLLVTPAGRGYEAGGLPSLTDSNGHTPLSPSFPEGSKAAYMRALELMPTMDSGTSMGSFASAPLTWTQLSSTSGSVVGPMVGPSGRYVGPPESIPPSIAPSSAIFPGDPEPESRDTKTGMRPPPRPRPGPSRTYQYQQEADGGLLEEAEEEQITELIPPSYDPTWADARAERVQARTLGVSRAGAESPISDAGSAINHLGVNISVTGLGRASPISDAGTEFSDDHRNSLPPPMRDPDYLSDTGSLSEASVTSRGSRPGRAL